jgi:hypothetical protein
VGGLGGLSALLVAAGLLAVGCGSESQPASAGGERAEIATTAGAVADAMEAGDGQAACGLIAEEGQKILVEVVRRDLGAQGVEDCESAVAAIARSRRGFRSDSISHSAKDVTFVESEDDYAQIECADGRNVWTMVRTEDGWRVAVPLCHD